MTQQQEFDLILKTCVPPMFWDTIDGKTECWYWLNRDSEGYWVNKAEGCVCFGPFKTLSRATRELRKVIAGRIDGVLRNKEMYVHE